MPLESLPYSLRRELDRNRTADIDFAQNIGVWTSSGLVYPAFAVRTPDVTLFLMGAAWILLSLLASWVFRRQIHSMLKRAAVSDPLYGLLGNERTHSPLIFLQWSAVVFAIVMFHAINHTMLRASQTTLAAGGLWAISGLLGLMAGGGLVAAGLSWRTRGQVICVHCGMLVDANRQLRCASCGHVRSGPRDLRLGTSQPSIVLVGVGLVIVAVGFWLVTMQS